MPKIRHFRLLIAAAIPLAVTVWFSVPALQPASRTLEGQAGILAVCPVTCADLLTVDAVPLACKHDFAGYPHSCRRRHLVTGTVKVTYVPLPSVASVLGVSPTAGVVTRIEKDGEVVFRKSASAHVWAALYGGWVFHAIYWPAVLLAGRFWPDSWLARRRKRATNPSEA